MDGNGKDGVLLGLFNTGCCAISHEEVYRRLKAVGNRPAMGCWPTPNAAFAFPQFPPKKRHPTVTRLPLSLDGNVLKNR